MFEEYSYYKPTCRDQEYYNISSTTARSRAAPRGRLPGGDLRAKKDKLFARSPRKNYVVALSKQFLAFFSRKSTPGMIMPLGAARD